MAGEILAGLGAFKTMLDIAKSMKDLNDTAARSAAAIELHEKILSAQMQQAALIERVRELELQVTEFETWDAEKQRYELKSLPPGVYVYALKKEAVPTEEPHCICQTCYQRGKKSVLHKSETNQGIYHFTCNECGADLKVGHWQPPQIITDDDGDWRV